MSPESDKSGRTSDREMRASFPEACKWFEPDSGQTVTEQAASEVEERFRLLQEKGTAPCDNCPLCPGHG